MYIFTFYFYIMDKITFELFSSPKYPWLAFINLGQASRIMVHRPNMACYGKRNHEDNKKCGAHLELFLNVLKHPLCN